MTVHLNYIFEKCLRIDIKSDMYTSFNHLWVTTV